MPEFDPAYSINPGCPQRLATGGAPRQCGAPEAYAVPWRYKYPRPRIVRLYPCEIHGRDVPNAEPLTAQDRATIAGRRAARRAQMDRARLSRGTASRTG